MHLLGYLHLVRGEIKYNDEPRKKDMTLDPLITEIARNEKDHPECTIIKDSKTREKIRHAFDGIRMRIKS